MVVVGLPLVRGQERRLKEGKPSVPDTREVAAQRTAVAAQARAEDLERRKDQRLAEIREAELDRLAGKLSQEDFEDVERTLRAEAVELLRELDEARAERDGGPSGPPAGQPPAGPEAS